MGEDIEYGVDGLLLYGVHVDENSDIQLEFGDEMVRIGSMGELLQSPEFDDGVFTTGNGLVVCIEEFIEHMRVDKKMAKAIMKAQPIVKDDTLPFCERLTLFYGLLYVRLRGHHVNQTPAIH